MSDLSNYTSVALVGVPNVGKSTIFNQLTGLNQKVGNFPGVTVDKKTGKLNRNGKHINIIDLPGVYSLYPRSEDEQVVYQVLCVDRTPEAILAIVDASNLERGLFLTSQLIDLGYPMALALNMSDDALKQGVKINRLTLERSLGIPVFSLTAIRSGEVSQLAEVLVENKFSVGKKSNIAEEIWAKKSLDFNQFGSNSAFELWQKLQVLGKENSLFLDHPEVQTISIPDTQRLETKLRYQHVHQILKLSVRVESNNSADFSRRIDSFLLNPYAGLAIFFSVLFLIFQAIFHWASVPMDWIDQAFALASTFAQSHLPSGALTDLISQGIIPGLGGIVIFVPQIALLFGFLGILEDTGYMARAVFITDRIMRPFGLNGRSVVPLISGLACAIPAIMAARTIANRKDKLITIFVTPFMSCSARLPVYIILIGLLFPGDDSGFFNRQGTALFFMYLLGIAAAFASAFVMKLLMKSKLGGGLVLALPRYRLPRIRDIIIQMYEKSKTFVWEAGKVILAISILLWVLASYGPGEAMKQARTDVPIITKDFSETDRGNLIAAQELQASYAGHIGRFIEPVIAPLGYDWKIGIALIASFAAREVFVSTIATLYALGSDNDDFQTLQDRLATDKQPDGRLTYTAATVWSLLVFYAFAMQCMSTVAVVYRETNSIKWPVMQTIYMSALAYVSALLVFQFLS